MGPDPQRRVVLQGLAGSGLLALVPRSRLVAAVAASPPAGAAGRFLDAAEMATLRAVTARLLPGPPDDPDPGAIEAGCAGAIDALLGALTFDPPLVHAGGPWSARAGGTTDAMAHFVPMDRLTELAWRIRLEGTLGRPERLFAGPVVGRQQIYRTGLADIDRLARAGGAARFTALAGPAQDTLLRSGAAADFVGEVLGDAIDAMFGAPEYHGNRDRVGWRWIGWPGDAQPRGYTDREVSSLDVGTTELRDAVAARRALETYVPGIVGLR